MKQFFKKSLLKVSKIFKLGLVDEALFLIPVDLKVQEVKPIRLKAELSVALHHREYYGDRFERFIAHELSNRFAKELPKYFEVKIYEDVLERKIQVVAILNILENENRI